MDARFSRWLLLPVALAACATPSKLGVELRPAAPIAARESAIDVEHYALELALDPCARSLSGECRVRFVSLQDGLRTVELDLVGLRVSSVHDASGRALEWSHDGRVLAIGLADPLARGADQTLEVVYAGEPRRGLWFAGERDGCATHVFTQGQCDEARAWFPCVDDPSERATSELAVDLPAGWTSIAAGELVDRSESPGGRARDHWRIATPHPSYLATLVAGELDVVRDEWDGIPLLYVAETRHAGALQPTFAPTPEVLGFLSDLTGVRYPFPKYSQACVANFPFGGMENVSATTMTDAILTDERGRRDSDALGLIVHEAAHQWFGDLLTCADWSHVWLNEGFATYATLLYTEATLGADLFRADLRDVQETYLALDVGERRRPTVWSTCRDPLDLFFTGQAYQGAASRLHLLRFVVGDGAFFRGIRRYVADNSGRGVVTTDLRDAMERESGVDLGDFFRQWFDSPGYPEFAVRWRWIESARKVELTVEQVQSPAAGTPAVFRTPVAIGVRDSSGPRSVRLEIEKRRQVFEIDAPERPTWVAFDEYGWIPKRARVERDFDEWLAIAEHDDDVNGRRDAVAALGARLSRAGGDAERGRAAQALIERLGSDSSAAVRAAAARALGGVRVSSEHSIATALIAAAQGDGSARVRVNALESLAGMGESDGLARVGHAAFEAGYSYATMAAAALLVARADPGGAREWIAARTELESPHGAIRAGLVAALASLQGEDVLAELRRTALDSALAPAAREVAVRALGSRGRHVPAVSRELAALLATGDYRLQSSVVDALAEIGDAPSLRALAAHHARCGDVRQRRAIEAALRRGQ